LALPYLVRLVQPLAQLLGGQLLVLLLQVVRAADAVALWQAASRGVSRGSSRHPENTTHSDKHDDTRLYAGCPAAGSADQHSVIACALLMLAKLQKVCISGCKQAETATLT